MANQYQMYTLRVELLDVDPMVWRRVRVPADIDLASLHIVFQIAMGWTDSHQHAFTIGNEEYAADEDDEDLSFEAEIPLNSVLNGAGEFFYSYDFGDDWQHRVVVEAVTEMGEDWQFPVCLAGERACPPEDVGGPPGYEDFLDVLAAPGDDRHAETLLWVGGVFDPEAFDVNRANRELNGLCLVLEDGEEFI